MIMRNPDYKFGSLNIYIDEESLKCGGPAELAQPEENYFIGIDFFSNKVFSRKTKMDLAITVEKILDLVLKAAGFETRKTSFDFGSEEYILCLKSVSDEQKEKVKGLIEEVLATIKHTESLKNPQLFSAPNVEITSSGENMVRSPFSAKGKAA